MKIKNNIIMILACLSTVLAFVASIYFIFIAMMNVPSYPQAEKEIVAQMKLGFGDLIAGTVGILLSFAATLFLFVTFKEQRKQFSENHIDADKNRFESTFFNLLSMLYQVRENINKEIALCTDNEMKSIKEFYNGFKDYYLAQADTEEQKEIEDYLSQDQRNTVEQEKIEYHLGQLYENYIKTKACNINYYYRYVFNMINFVIGQWIHAENGKAHIHKYLNFIQAQMSDEELALIFYDAISHHGLDNNYSHQFKETIDCYGFLENINPHILLDRSHHIIFPKTKFKFLNRGEKMSKQQ